MNLFTELEEKNKQIPLADKLRPQTLQEYLGQTNVINENSPYVNLFNSNRLFSFIFWGPPGCGKTTLARIIAKHNNVEFKEISAVTSGIKEIKEAVDIAKSALRYDKRTMLFIDEIHRYSKVQQDALLPYLENGTIYLVGSTTENPSFQVIPALLSRVRVVVLNAIDDESILRIVRKGFKYLIDNYGKISLEKEVGQFIVNYARGDARTALNIVESAYFAANFNGDERFLDVKTLENLVQQRNVKYSTQEHYDCASAFQKSLRGSDADAAIYYLAKMLSAGEDVRFIARRLIICAAEDVGNADPQAVLIATNALRAVEHIGMPEARIILAQAVEYVARAPKSNKSYLAIESALADINSGKDYPPPMHLRDAHYKDASKYGFGEGYLYSHSHPDEYQQFMPDEMKDVKYF